MWGRITRMFGYIQVDKLENYEAYIAMCESLGGLPLLR